jgi:hypothetical protein
MNLPVDGRGFSISLRVLLALLLQIILVSSRSQAAPALEPVGLQQDKGASWELGVVVEPLHPREGERVVVAITYEASRDVSVPIVEVQDGTIRIDIPWLSAASPGSGLRREVVELVAPPAGTYAFVVRFVSWLDLQPTSTFFTGTLVVAPATSNAEMVPALDRLALAILIASLLLIGLRRAFR